MAFIAFAAVAVAHTPQEIVSRMDAEMNKHDESEGFVMTFSMKIPILGQIETRTYTLGDKIRMVAERDGKTIITWIGGDTQWEYNSEKREVEITKNENQQKSEAEGNAELFEGITDGYDVTLDKETASAWYLKCKRSKSNPDKDAPKKLDLVVSKGTYMPIKLSTKVSGVTITMSDIAYGVTEKDVTFNPKDFPGVKIIDKR